MAQAPDPTTSFRAFVQQQALAMRAGDRPPASADEWQRQRAALRTRLIQSWGGFPAQPCPLEPRLVGEPLQREGYRLEKLLLQTRPGIWLTANAYVPDGDGPHPAVLCVHGHWRLAKQEPVVQSRCIGLAKLGFFVLMVDAFGAGERGVGKPLGEYHGEMVAATLWPTGLALAGLQVYENMRAVDYLQTRPEVDPARIGITGASGGGNQTMYAGAIDERFRCVVPVCSVGTYQAYLSAACCMCEVTPGALSYTEEAAVLGLVAPRALMVVSATRDAFQFSVGEARKSLAGAQHIFKLLGAEDQVRHAIFESGHDYNQAMREAMYGWMTRHLKGTGDGEPIAEPPLTVEEPETLRCFPADSRPDDFLTLPQFAAREARRVLSRHPVPDHREQWQTDRPRWQSGLLRVLGEFPEPTELAPQWSSQAETDAKGLVISTEPGLTVHARLRPARGARRGRAVLLDLAQGQQAAAGDLAEQLVAAGWDVVAADLRATGMTANPGDRIGRAPDHNSAEWSMWIGRPLLGQWAWDVARLLTALNLSATDRAAQPTVLIGVGAAGPLALTVAALDERVTQVVTIGSLATYVTDVPYEHQWLGCLVPRMLRRVGDIGHLAALIAPRPLVVAGAVLGAGTQVTAEPLRNHFAVTRAAYALEQAAERLTILDSSEPEPVVAALGRAGT